MTYYEYVDLLIRIWMVVTFAFILYLTIQSFKGK